MKQGYSGGSNKRLCAYVFSQQLFTESRWCFRLGKVWKRDDSEQDTICSCCQKAYSLEGECIVSNHEVYKCNSFLFSFIIIMPFPLTADTCWWNKFNKAYLNLAWFWEVSPCVPLDRGCSRPRFSFHPSHPCLPPLIQWQHVWSQGHFRDARKWFSNSEVCFVGIWASGFQKRNPSELHC